MKPPVFKYAAPESIDECIALLERYGDDAKIISGGQSLMPLLSLRMVRPAVIIDIGRIAALEFWREQNGYIGIGALLRQRALETDETLAKSVPAMAEAVKLIGHPSTRSRGTIVGSMCHADPAAELPVCATVLDAEFVLQSTSGMRTLKSKEFFLDALTTAIAPNELAVEVRIPKAREKIGYAFVEIARRHGDFALVCAAAAVSIGSGKPADACVALGGIGSRPQLFNYRDFASAKQFSENELTGFANFIAGQVKPGSDLHATADYRRAISAALTKQAMATAMKRANIRSE